jgi:1-acyl-sn-glycerol-3-phosphate acyltransferase
MQTALTLDRALVRRSPRLGSNLRAAWTLFAYLALTLPLMPLQALFVALKSPLAVALPLAYHRWCCRIFGIRLTIEGRVHDGVTLFAANHLSYLDITVLGAVLPASFISKAEVMGWPLFGTLAKLQRTVFIERKRSRAHEHRDALVERLHAGDSLILFPEGTSSDGNRVLPFKSSLFAAVWADAHEAGHPLAVQPVTLAVTHLDRLPLGRDWRGLYAWVGDVPLGRHLWDFASLGRIDITVTLHPPVQAESFASRKELAQHCQDRVVAGFAAALTGRRLALSAPDETDAD